MHAWAGHTQASGELGGGGGRRGVSGVWQARPQGSGASATWYSKIPSASRPVKVQVCEAATALRRVSR
eukprot:scaffold48599_cov61-Phaeocystis_antarctica.AAC.3